MVSQAEQAYDRAAKALTEAMRRFYAGEPFKRPMFGMGKNAIAELNEATKAYAAALHPTFRHGDKAHPAPPEYYQVVIDNMKPGEDGSKIRTQMESDRLEIKKMRLAWSQGQ